MIKIISAILFISFLIRVASVTIENATFYTELVSDQQIGVQYKRVNGSYFGPVPPNSVQCAFACTNEDNCKSVYVDGEACVFGVYDVTAFGEGELVSPDPRQRLRVKG